MSDYKAKQKEYRELSQPVRNSKLSKPPSQRLQRRRKLVDPMFTKPNREKNPHVVNDYTEQREDTKPPANLSNYVRNQYRKKYRKEIHETK